MWQVRTPTPPEQWGMSLVEALQPGSVPKVLAETVPDSVIMSIDGYLRIMGLILEANQAYLEAELEKAAMSFMYPRVMDKNELFTTYTAYLEVLGRELDQQLQPEPPIDERIKAIVLLRNCRLTAEQRLQLALKRTGSQPFREVADRLRTLDRPEAFLQQSSGATPVHRAYPVAVEEVEPEGAAREPSVSDLTTAESIRAMVQEEMASIVPWQDPQEQDDPEPESDEEVDSDGELVLDFDENAEYSESEALQKSGLPHWKNACQKRLVEGPH